jgi:transposase
VDDCRVVSGIVYDIRNGLLWKDAPRAYSPHKTLYNRYVRWSRGGVFERISAGLAGKTGEPDRLMIDATHLNPIEPPPVCTKGVFFAAAWNRLLL